MPPVAMTSKTACPGSSAASSGGSGGVSPRAGDSSTVAEPTTHVAQSRTPGAFAKKLPQSSQMVTGEDMGAARCCRSHAPRQTDARSHRG